MFRSQFDRGIVIQWRQSEVATVLKCLIYFNKRNAKAFSLNATVDVRLRRRLEMIFNISEAIRASDLKIFHKVALDSLHISTGNDVIDYFRSQTNRTNV